MTKKRKLTPMHQALMDMGFVATNTEPDRWLKPIDGKPEYMEVEVIDQRTLTDDPADVYYLAGIVERRKTKGRLSESVPVDDQVRLHGVEDLEKFVVAH